MNRARNLPRHEPHLLVMPTGWWALSDGRTVLTPMEERDVKGLATSVNDPGAVEMLKHWHDLSAPTAAARQAEIRQALMSPWDQHDYRFTVFADGKIAGARWITKKHTGPASCGGWIHPAMRRRGTGHAALMLALHFYARSLGGRRVVTGTRPDNAPAQANLARCGFEHTGHETDSADGLVLQVWERPLQDLRALGDIPVDSASTHPRLTKLHLIMGKSARQGIR